MFVMLLFGILFICVFCLLLICISYFLLCYSFHNRFSWDSHWYWYFYCAIFYWYGSQVILPSPTSLRTLECMLCQAKGRSRYVSPMGFPSGAYALGSHFATGPSWLGSHWLSLLGVSWGVDLRTPAVMAGASDPRKIGHTPWPATNQPTNQPTMLSVFWVCVEFVGSLIEVCTKCV